MQRKLYHLRQLQEPQQWYAGSIGGAPLYFDCAGCEAKEPVIHAFVGEPGEPAIVKRPDGPMLALYCESCTDNLRMEARIRELAR